MAVLDQAQLGGVTYDLQDTKAQAMIAPAFSAAQAYSAGDSVTYNGTLYTFTADHAAGAWIGTDAATVPGGVTGEVADLRSALSYDESILDDISFKEYTPVTGTDEEGKSIPYTGVVTDAVSSYHCVTYSVAGGESFRINASTVSGGYYYIFTDGTDTISKSERNTSGGVASNTDMLATAPMRATTLVVAYNASSSYIHASVKKITGHGVAGIPELDQRIDSIEDLLGEESATVDVPQADMTIHDNVFMFTSGSESSEVSGWQYAEYEIPENALSLIVTATAGQSARLWILKDASGTVLGYSSDSSSASKKTETITLSSYPTAKKVFVNDKKSGNLAISYTYNRKVVDGENVYIDGQDLPSILGIGSSDKLYGKVLCCVGDSITYGAGMDAEGITNDSNITVYNCNASGDFTETTSNFLKSWGWQIASRHNMTFYNGGVSGSTMQGLADKNGFSLANGRYTKLPGSIDYLLIWFGWNDTAYGTLGTISDNTNESYYGGFNVVLPYLINKYPYAKIGLIVPFGTTAGHREAVRLLGNKWGVAVWDNYQGGTPLYFGKETSVGVDESIVTENKAKFQANGAHPNYKGHRQLADMIEEWMKGI